MGKLSNRQEALIVARQFAAHVEDAINCGIADDFECSKAFLYAAWESFMEHMAEDEEPAEPLPDFLARLDGAVRKWEKDE